MEIRDQVEKDVAMYREKAAFYRQHHLHEAAVYADRLASNLELALTTLPRPDDQEIA